MVALATKRKHSIAALPQPARQGEGLRLVKELRFSPAQTSAQRRPAPALTLLAEPFKKKNAKRQSVIMKLKVIFQG